MSCDDRDATSESKGGSDDNDTHGNGEESGRRYHIHTVLARTNTHRTHTIPYTHSLRIHTAYTHTPIRRSAHIPCTHHPFHKHTTPPLFSLTH